MDPLKALADRFAELCLGDGYADNPANHAYAAEQLMAALNRSGWKLVRFTDHDKLNREAWDALSKEMGGSA